MCGLIGYFTPRGSQPQIINLVSALAAMSHRGPDGEDTYLSPDRCFQAGFCRLSIIDLESGQQPIIDDSENRVLLGNGEIYNYIELKKEFAAYPFRSKGDMETILPAHGKYGEDFVHYLNGMYALALYERAEHRLTLVRDRLGVKPLYWAKLPNGGIIFGSEIKAILATGLIRSEIDESAVNNYLSHGYVPSPQTLFTGIQKIPPAHKLIVDASGKVNLERYWQPGVRADLPTTPIDVEKHLLTLLEDSIRLQMRSDVPVGALLSGGIDSGLLVALASRHSSRPINTFTVSFEGAAVDEAPLARAVAERYGTNHTEARVSANGIGDELVNLAWFTEEPLNDPALLPNYLIEKVLSDQVTVALNGTGGDELFAGYGRYFQLPIEQRYLGIPAWLRRGVVEPLTNIANPMNAWRLSRAELFSQNGGAYLHAHSTQFPEPIRKLMGNQMAIPVPAQIAFFEEALEQNNGQRQSAALNADMSTYLAEDLLPLLDRTTMAVSVEGRVPFLDHRFVEACLAVPESIRTPNNQQKFLERSMAKDLLPAEVLSAPKQGFASPVPHWMKNGLAESARRLLTRSESLDRGWWSKPGIERLLAQPDLHGFRIYSLMMLELSVRLFVEQPLSLSAPNVSLEEFI
jgi:asparagine synthase (glutamine-hydrolysing)